MELGLGLSRDWNSAEAAYTVLGLSRALGGELALDKVLGAHRAVDVALETHTVLGEVVGLHVELDVGLDMGLNGGVDLVLDRSRVPEIAVVENTGGALDWCMVLGVGMDVGQEVDIAALIALDTGQNSGVDGSLALHVVSAPGRRHPRRGVEHNPQNSV